MPIPDVGGIPPQMVYTIDQLEVGKIIGVSGATRVYRGVLKPRSMAVALKHLWGEKAVEYCKREVAALQKLDHPNVVKIFGYCEVSTEEAYVLLELSEDGTLSTLALKDLSVYERLIQALKWSLQTAEGLRYLHINDLLHLDVKPSNVLRFGDVVKICDFDTARKIDKENDSTKGTGRLTYAYAAPEVINMEDASHVSDLYSLGCLIFELITGERYCHETDEIKIAKDVKESKLPSVLQRPWPPCCPEEVSLLTERLLSYDGNERSPVDEVIQTLKSALRELQSTKLDAVQLFAASQSPPSTEARSQVTTSTIQSPLSTLFLVAASNDALSMRDLAAANVSVDTREEDGTALVHVTASTESVDVIAALAELGADFMSEDSLKRTPLHVAAARGHVKAMEALLTRESIDTVAENGFTPLHYAIAGGHADVVKLLISRGANVEAQQQIVRPFIFSLLKRGIPPL
ncbi:protein kinase, putative [Bodo saltans]|uniref:Protein kinase, putative n=1 Tax=Bodo saltans TaxID=75058 RepID=A0A0S4IJQ5_BODSA|nr:protein kinase, putative [Bodo saltans]|eukprot:CUE92238.1 protein kinase, putative [Bodo saltans]